MATQQSAKVFITNKTDGAALIQIEHNNSSNGTQSGVWVVPAGQTVGPLTVQFMTGIGSYGILDYWRLRLSVRNGSKPGIYNSVGPTPASNGWKECQLQSKDAGQSLTFTVDTNSFQIDLPSGGCSASMSQASLYKQITNVFVLMLENHSFDNIFAFSGIPGITAATTSNNNFYNGFTYNVQKGAPSSMVTDPGHEFFDTFEQLCNVSQKQWDPNKYNRAINNGGFVFNYATSSSEQTGVPPAGNRGDIMKCFDTQKQLPVTYQLASQFAICDHWFSSMPGPTWPNRFFLHGASSAGWADSPSTGQITKWETVSGFEYPNGSIFDAMNKAKVTWRLYYDPNGPPQGMVPQVAALKSLHFPTNFTSINSLASDLQNPFYQGQYTFIEPNYGDTISDKYTGGSSQHPMDGVTGGEQLIKTTYEAIRNSPLWYSSLLIITYDEHGGFYDSVAPPKAPSPGDSNSPKYNPNSHGFNFDLFGVRVPAVVISPWMLKGVVDQTQYDHSSVLKTLETLFNLPSLTNRDASASHVLNKLTLSWPRLDCPTQLNNPAKPLAVTKKAAAAAAKPLLDREPLRTSGNAVGFMHIMLKTELELSSGTKAEKKAIVEKFKKIKTKKAAQSYFKRMHAKIEAFQKAEAKKSKAKASAPKPKKQAGTKKSKSTNQTKKATVKKTRK